MNVFAWIFQKKRTEKWIAGLVKSHKKLQETKMVLTQFEKKMILDALTCDEYEGKLHTPATRAFIRSIYRDLKIKIDLSIKEEK